MPTLPNPFEFAGCAEHAPASSAGSSFAPASQVDEPASYFDDDPLPLCLTEPHEGIDRDIEAILRVIFGVHNRRGIA